MPASFKFAQNDDLQHRVSLPMRGSQIIDHSLNTLRKIGQLSSTWQFACRAFFQTRLLHAASCTRSATWGWATPKHGCIPPMQRRLPRGLASPAGGIGGQLSQSESGDLVGKSVNASFLPSRKGTADHNFLDLLSERNLERKGLVTCFQNARQRQVGLHSPGHSGLQSKVVLLDACSEFGGAVVLTRPERSADCCGAVAMTLRQTQCVLSSILLITSYRVICYLNREIYT